MRVKLTTLKIIFAIILVLTAVTCGLEILWALNRPTELWGYQIDAVVICTIFFPVFFVELELYWSAKYFLVDAYRTREKTVCKVICLLLALIVAYYQVCAICGNTISQYIAWSLVFLFPAVHLVNFILDRRNREQQEWIQEHKHE